jgi:hypothetical protein
MAQRAECARLNRVQYMRSDLRASESQFNRSVATSVDVQADSW